MVGSGKREGLGISLSDFCFGKVILEWEVAKLVPGRSVRRG